MDNVKLVVWDSGVVDVYNRFNVYLGYLRRRAIVWDADVTPSASDKVNISAMLRATGLID